MFRIDIDRSHFALPCYIFKEAIVDPVPIKNFEGKSLEEIEQEYGRQTAMLVYWCACNGKDLTKIHPPKLKTKDVVELCKTENSDSIKLYLHANAYTDATEDRCILNVVNINPQVSKQHRRKMMTDAIYRLFT